MHPDIVFTLEMLLAPGVHGIHPGQPSSVPGHFHGVESLGQQPIPIFEYTDTHVTPCELYNETVKRSIVLIHPTKLEQQGIGFKHETILTQCHPRFV